MMMVSPIHKHSILKLAMVHYACNKGRCIPFLTIVPFEVAFVQRIYAVPESAGSVEVCVNLTRSPVDILDEFVVVEVYNFPSSIYVPADVALASESVHKNLHLFHNVIPQFLIHLPPLVSTLWHQGLTMLSRQ